MSKTTIPTGGLADAAVTTAKITDANITTAKIADDAVTAAKSTGLGISMAQQWRLTSSATGDLEPIASNWEINDNTGYGDIGSDMTQSSGIFTFPSTGIYLITFVCIWQLSGDTRWAEAQIRTTTNNSTYASANETYHHIAQAQSDSTYSSATGHIIFDVTDTAQCKVQFHDRVNNDNCGTYGASGYQTTGVTFVRLGDT
jgi:hypothetical protein